jgi:hypothetical protein
LAYRPPAQPTRGRSVAGILGAVVALMVLGAASSVALFVRSATSNTPGSGAAPRAAAANLASTPSDAPRWWYSRGEPAFTRAGANSAIVGMLGFQNGAVELAALDGATGKLLWHVAAPADTHVYADGTDVILGYDAAKRIQRYDAKTGKKLWSINVADFVHDITFGSGCASVRFGEPLGIETETGSLKSCTPTRPALLGAQKGVPHDVSLKQGELDLVGSIALDNQPVNPDPPHFSVKASRAGKELWRSVPTTLEPVWQTDGFIRSLALTPAGIFIYGRNSSDHHARWLLLDAATGTTVYSSSSDVKVDADLWLDARGPHVFVIHDHRLETYVAASGKLAWQVGE